MPPPSLWQYVPIGDYEPPEGMVAEPLKGGIAGFCTEMPFMKVGLSGGVGPEAPPHE